jgi:hypothetical protein
MTHDLIKKILESLDARVQKIVVNDLRDNTFYAVIHLRLGSADITVDSRPSDAIALALRVGAPIFVDEEVVHKARTVEVAKETEIGTGKGDDPAKIKEWLESLKPGDFDRIERGKDPNRPDEWMRVGLFTNNYLPQIVWTLRSRSGRKEKPKPCDRRSRVALSGHFMRGPPLGFGSTIVHCTRWPPHRPSGGSPR